MPALVTFIAQWKGRGLEWKCRRCGGGHRTGLREVITHGVNQVPGNKSSDGDAKKACKSQTQAEGLGQDFLRGITF